MTPPTSQNFGYLSIGQNKSWLCGEPTPNGIQGWKGCVPFPKVELYVKTYCS